jgi:hypothetical protein
MDTGKNSPRLLGLMFVIVAALSLISGLILTPLGYSLAGSPDNISRAMVSFSQNPAIVQLSMVGFLLEAVAIVLLTVLLYSILKKQNVIIARWAFGLWVIEAVGIVFRQINAFSFLHTGQRFASAGAPDSSYFQTLGSLFYDLMHFSYDAQMIFYCTGGILFYSLFLKSRYVPKGISIWGIAAASLGFVGELLAIFGFNVPLYVFLPILPFELVIGIWLMVKGIRVNTETR